jgi:protein-disulfide isomerase
VSGKPDALVTVAFGYEYACPYCEKSRPVLTALEERYGDAVRVVHDPYVVHPDLATDAALVACAAHRQGKFDQMDEILWEKAFKARKFERAHLEALGQEIGLDPVKMKADMDGSCKSWIAGHQGALAEVGVHSTPAFFINGRPMTGLQSIEKMTALIDEELAKARERVAAGTAPARYYQDWVMGRGLKKLEPARL